MNTVIDEKIELWRSGGAPKSSKLSGIDVLIEPLMIELNNCQAHIIQERRERMKVLIQTEERDYNDELARLGKFLWREV